jgi:hypothetical protein
MTSASLESRVRRDEEIVRNTLRTLLLKAGVLLGWLVLIVAICFAVLLLR